MKENIIMFIIVVLMPTTLVLDVIPSATANRSYIEFLISRVYQPHIVIQSIWFATHAVLSLIFWTYLITQVSI